MMINPLIYFLLFLKASLFSTGGFSNLPSLPSASNIVIVAPSIQLTASEQFRDRLAYRAHFTGHLPAVPRHPDIVPGQHDHRTRHSGPVLAHPGPVRRRDRAP